MKLIRNWNTIIPLLAILAYAADLFSQHIIGQIVVVGLLIGSILAAVVHAEVIAHRVGEPFGTIILAVSVTVIEVSLIVSLMLAGGDKVAYLARDTVFAAVMILLTMIIGLCILIGSFKYSEQTFQEKSVNTALVSLVSILVLSLVLPNYTGGAEESGFKMAQLLFTAVICLAIYGTFIYIQTLRHRNYFLSDKADAHKNSDNNDKKQASIYLNLAFLIVSLTIVVLLAKTISPTIEAFIVEAGLPQSLLGVIIAAVILLPEAIAAVRAAKNDDIQTSLNLSLGSALAAIGLTIPTVAIVSYAFDIEIMLGLDNTATLLLGLSVFTVMLSLSKGRTNLLYGVILIALFATYIFTLS